MAKSNESQLMSLIQHDLCFFCQFSTMALPMNAGASSFPFRAGDDAVGFVASRGS